MASSQASGAGLTGADAIAASAVSRAALVAELSPATLANSA